MPIGAQLMARGVLTQAKLDLALADQRTSGDRLDRVLLRLGLVTKRQLLEALGEQFHLPVIDLASTPVEPEVLGAIPAKLVFRQRCVPIARSNGSLLVATSDPFELAALDELRLITNARIELVLADDDDLQRFIRTHYGVGTDTLDALSAGLEAKPAARAGDEADAAQDASVVRLVNEILAEAIAERATDVHIEPYEHELDVRYRIDGVLQKANVPATINRFGPAVVSRIKIMANLNIAEKRLPQDGRITFVHRPPGAGPLAPGTAYDLRVSIIPMLFGEGVVLRVLSKASALMPLADLGMPRTILATWERIIVRPHGIVLVTGPTGSGKSTTLYASLHRIVSPEVKVVTIEDPVEYHVPGVNQIQVHSTIGLTFAAGLRSVLRHDPDVVLIGEIRDKETAETAIQASLTGHLVFSTLHTNDAVGAATRLLDMGVEPFLVASSLEAVLAQRLVRRVCDACREAYAPDRATLPKGLSLPGATLSRGKGCRECRSTGYRGRVGIYELLTLTDPMRELVVARAPAPRLLASARGDDALRPLSEDAFEKVARGITTLDEVLSALAS